ncbi:hypothetical protein M2271_003456 [Streptomyces sp. LBL]|uniref:hypothetical protein n=1 Tax=Streptomyces sp. LBL TaxID=2940562 RepID=UPI002474A2CD|nr:hypothetical protein [Streptomyces sp. LBL]MDH6625645.1 hypothetical protein [Streptomyces sp. LBL]
MFRGTTVRTTLALLTTTLLALQFFAPTASFATAHTARHAEANAQPGIKPAGPAGKAPRDETATHRNCDPTGNPTGPLRTRDRHRPVDLTPERPDRPALTEEPAHTGTQVPTGAFPQPRPSAAHSPAALQVFRC